jgi:hypothetical protein
MPTERLVVTDKNFTGHEKTANFELLSSQKVNNQAPSLANTHSLGILLLAFALLAAFIAELDFPLATDL